MPYAIETTDFGMMPNQATGALDGKPFYWRARHGAWTLRVDGQILEDCEEDGAGWWANDTCRKKLTAILERHANA